LYPLLLYQLPSLCNKLLRISQNKSNIARGLCSGKPCVGDWITVFVRIENRAKFRPSATPVQPPTRYSLRPDIIMAGPAKGPG
jgi:hypothetical protein